MTKTTSQKKSFSGDNLPGTHRGASWFWKDWFSLINTRIHPGAVGNDGEIGFNRFQVVDASSTPRPNR
jgi:hypothetical protein